MGICGAKMKIVAEPEQRGRTPNADHKNKQRQKRNKLDDEINSKTKQLQKQAKNQEFHQNGISQVDKNKTKDKDIRSRNNSESIEEIHRLPRRHQELEEYDGNEAFQVQIKRQYSKNGGYGGQDGSNQDLERNGGDASSRIEETKRVLTFKKGHIIDRGSYGEVYQCLDLNTGQLYAVKTIRKNKDKVVLEREVASLAKEISEYKKLSHKNIVKYIDTELDEDEKGINIIFEFVSGGSIRQMLDKFGKFNEKVISIYTNQVLQGLNYLHQNNVIHRDIKGGNILIDTDGTIKLTDFGTLKLHKKDAFMFQNTSMSYISHTQQDSRIIQSQKPFWTAPEVLKNESQSEAHSDIWSVGCLVIEMITALPPYYHLNDLSSEEIAQYIREGNLPNFPEKLSDQCLEFLQNTLQVDPKKRATVNELLKLSFIADPDQIELISEQYSPNQVRSGIFQSQNSLGYVHQDFPMKQMFRASQNGGFYTDEPPNFMKEGDFFPNNNNNNTNGNGFNHQNSDDNVIDLRGLSQIHQDQRNNKKTRENTPQSMYISQQKSNKNGEEPSKFLDKIHQKEQQTFENQIKRLFKESNVNYNEARDEYQQQLISQFKEFEDKNVQELNAQFEANQKQQEQRDVEDEILKLIKKKKENRKNGNVAGSNTPQQAKNQSSSTFDTSIQNPPPQIRFQVVFNNPKDNFILLKQEETIKHNENLLKKQYNDIQQPELDQSPATTTKSNNNNNNNQFVQPPSIFNQNKNKEEEEDQDEDEKEEERDYFQAVNIKNEQKSSNSYSNIGSQEQRNSPQKQMQKINSNQKMMKKIDSTENTKLMMLQSDPISMTSLGVFDKVQGGLDDLNLYNFKVDFQNNKKSSKHQRSRTEQIGNKNGDKEASFFKEVKRDINGGHSNNNQKQLITDEYDEDTSENIVHPNQNNITNNLSDYHQSQNTSQIPSLQQNKQQSNNMVVEEFY